MIRSERPRVALVSSNFWPEKSGIGQITTELAEYLQAHDIDVAVATAMPYYPEWRIYREYRGSLFRSENRRGITVRRAWHFTRPAPGLVSRLLHELTLCLFGLPQIVRVMRGADMVYIVSPDLSLAFVSSRIAELMGVRQVALIEDVQPGAASDLGMIRSGRMIAFAQWMAERIYEAADEIYTLSDGMRERIALHTRDPRKIDLLPNTLDAEELNPGPAAILKFRKAFVPHGTFAVVHAGNMGRKQDLDIILRTAQRLRDEPSVHFYVFGDGAVKDEFIHKRDELSLSNVSHYAFQDREMFAGMLAGADLFVVSQMQEVVDIVLPLKLVTAMGAGATIVAACADTSETARVVRESGGGFIVPASDDESLAALIRKLRTGEIDPGPQRAKAKQYALARYDRDTIYGRQVEVIRKRWRPEAN